jgi:LPXTG-site transpeptidase (sortase) family protein
MLRKYRTPILIILLLLLALAAVLTLDMYGPKQYFVYSENSADGEFVPDAAAELAQSGKVEIPSLKITAPVLFGIRRSEEAFQVALRRGVVHYPGTAKPGELGNCYIFGHSSDYPWAKGDYKTVFKELPNIQKGTEIFVTDEKGNRFAYAVTDAFVASASDTHLLGQGDKKTRNLTLQTSYPLGTAFKRWIVLAVIRE